MNDITNNLKRRQDMNDDTYKHTSNIDQCKKLRMGGRLFLMPIHVVTCGLQGAELGRDETAILQMCVQLIDAVNVKIVGEKNIILQPSSLLDREADPEKIHISISSRKMTGLISIPNIDYNINLNQALVIFDDFIKENTSNDINAEVEIVPVTVGHLPLRSVLHREARFRNISLSNYWYNYFDLFEQMSLYYKRNFKTLEEICLGLQIDNSYLSSGIISNISQVIITLLKYGHSFCSKQIVMKEYKPAVFHVDDPIEEDVVVMIKPIDYKTPISQVLPFFNGVNVADGGVAVIMSEGRRSNKILIRFVDKIQRDIALLRDKHHLEPGSSRYITMSTFDSRDFMKMAGYDDDLIRDYLTQIKSQKQVLLRMKGLPFTVTKGDILHFFNLNNTIVHLGLNGIFLIQKPTGELNGDAFIILEDEIQAANATNLKGSLIGNRYVEIFQSTPAEMNQVILGIKAGQSQSKLVKKSIKNREMENIDFFHPLSLPFSNINQRHDIIGAATVTTLIPKDATDSDFANFLGECQRNCIKFSRYNLNNPKGFTSYIASFKDIIEAESTAKMLIDKPFSIGTIQKEFFVKTLVLPLTSGSMSKTYNSLIYKVPLNTLNIMPSIFPISPSLYHPSYTLQNPLQISNGAMHNLYTLNQYSQLNAMPATIQSMFFNAQISSQFPIHHTEPYKGYISPSSPDSYPLNQSVLLQSLPPITNVVSPLPFDRSKILLLHGIQIPILQNECDAIFQSLLPYITALPKLHQSYQSFYAIFISSEDAKIALLRCPIIFYKNQTIQLALIN